MRWRIRNQLLAPLLLLLAGVAMLCTWTALASVRRARQQIEAQVRQVARTLGESSFPLTDNVLAQMKGLSGAEFVLVSPEGTRLATLVAGPDQFATHEGVVADWHELRLSPPIEIAGQRYLCGGVRLPASRARPGDALYILYPEALWRDALWEAVRPSLTLGIFLGLGCTALTLGVAHRLSRRIQVLERRTRRIADGDFTPLTLNGHDDELRDLGRSINEMTQRLSQFQEAVQKNERLRLLGQVSGGLAHQLRNGVTGARLAIQLHAGECRAAEPEALQVALRQLDLVENNLKRFLDLGRQETPRRDRCDLAALADETIGLLLPQCRHAQVELRWCRPDTAIEMRGDAASVRHLILNVLANAIEAAGPGGEVAVALRVDAPGAPRANLEIADSGPGPGPAIASRLFEPFVTTKPEGVGLGLAVARQAAEAHGGTITWDRSGGMTCFRIALPLEPSS